MYPLQEAILYAMDKHAGQTYGRQPYTFHLNEVQRFIIYFELPKRFPYILVAGWLHDVVEDTDATVFDINNLFGAYVSKVVYAVTDEPGHNRKERKSKTYIKIRAHGPEAVALKLADRIANISFSKATDQKLLSMYKKEHTGFYEALYDASHKLDEMWEYLEQLIGE